MSGHVKRTCAIGKCNATNLKKDRSLFQFPADQARCKEWAKACGIEREFNILQKHKTQLRNTYKRVCSVHFEDRYFKSFKRNRLTDDAVPTLYLSGKVDLIAEKLQCTVAGPSDDSIVLDEHSYCEPPPPVATPLNSATNVQDNVKQAQSPAVGNEQPDKRRVDQVSQTPITMLLQAKEVEDIRAELKTVRLKLRAQARKIKRLQERNAQLELERQSRPRTKECPTLLSNKQNVNILSEEEPTKLSRKGLRYSVAAKQKALGLFYLSPKSYHTFMNQYMLPSKRTLNRFIRNIKLKPDTTESLITIG